MEVRKPEPHQTHSTVVTLHGMLAGIHVAFLSYLAFIFYFISSISSSVKKYIKQQKTRARTLNENKIRTKREKRRRMRIYTV